MLREHVLAAARLLAGDTASAATVPGGDTFRPAACRRRAGARRLGILPDTTAVSEAVEWAWERFTLSSDAVALDPAEQAISQLQLWLLERGMSRSRTSPRSIGQHR